MSVISGVPWGSFFGSVLFLVFINDLPDCQVAPFADDHLMYQTIKCLHYTLKFQEDLTALSKWAEKWVMDFNVKKCNIFLFNSKGKFLHYSLHGYELKIAEEVEYMGVTIHDMKFTAQVTESSKLGIIKRALD